jgi:hypothetical protein
LHLLKESLPKLPGDDHLGMLLSYQLSYLVGLTRARLEGLDDIKSWYLSPENCIRFVDKRTSSKLVNEDKLMAMRLYILPTKSTTLAPSQIAENIISLYTSSRNLPSFLENALPLASIDWSSMPRTCVADPISPKPRCADENLEHVLMLSLFPNSLETTYEVLTPISHQRTDFRIIVILVTALIAVLGMMTCVLCVIWRHTQSHDIITFQAIPEVDLDHSRNDRIHSRFDIHQEVEEEDDNDNLHENQERQPLNAIPRYP